MRPSGSLRGGLGGVGLVACVLLLGACRANCEDACEKLLECDEIESARVSVEDCEASCEREMAQYEKWRDTDKQHRLEAERDCIVDSVCAEIAEGACYDEELFPFEMK